MIGKTAAELMTSRKFLLKRIREQEDYLWELQSRHFTKGMNYTFRCRAELRKSALHQLTTFKKLLKKASR